MLLDSQTVMWLVSGSGNLGRRTTAAIRKANNVYFSPISVLELTAKAMTGRMTLTDEFVELLMEQGLVELPYRSEDANTIRDFPALAHHDPFDRALLAQARSNRLSFVTADRLLLGLDLPFVLDARE